MTSELEYPLKWTKYLMLAQFGLISRDELEQDIKRYKRFEVQRLIVDLRRDLRVECQRGRRNLYVIKLVSLDLSGRLPNFRVEMRPDIDRLPAFLAAHENFDYVEIWFCRTRVDENVFSVAGRFVFTEEDGERSQCVEQVWRCSPRLLENYTKGFKYPYVRATRLSWGWPYTVKHLHLPRRSSFKRPSLMQEFFTSMRFVERERESICTFLVFLDTFGYRAYSLEYKVVGSRLSIIDWDTPNDKAAIATYHGAARSNDSKSS